MRKTLILLVLVAAISFFLGRQSMQQPRGGQASDTHAHLSDTSATPTTADAATAGTDAGAALLPAQMPSALAPTAPIWDVSDIRDEMRGTTTHLACVTATDSDHLRIGRGQICIRQRDGERMEAFFVVGEGQVLCGYSGCTVAVRFDDDAVRDFRGSGPSTGYHSVFITDADGFVRRMLSASHLTIEIEFYDAGRRQIQFENVGGLVWELPATRRRDLPRCVDLLGTDSHGPCR